MSDEPVVTTLKDHAIIIFDFELLAQLARAQKSSVNSLKEQSHNERSESPSSLDSTDKLTLLMKKRKRPDFSGLKIGDSHYSQINETFHSDQDEELNEKSIRYKSYIQLLDRQLILQSKSPFTLPQDLSGYGLQQTSPNVFEFVSSNIKLGFSHNSQLLTIRNKVVSKLTSKIICSFNFSQSEDLISQLQNEISIFNVSGIKSSNSIFIDGPDLLFSINTATNQITTTIKYKIYYGTFVNQTLVPNVTSKVKKLINRYVKPYPVSERVDVSTDDPYAPPSAQLFYNAMSNNASTRAPVTKNYDLPELETNLLKFQRKTVGWLLEKESVKYDWKTNRCQKQQLIPEHVVEEILSYLEDTNPNSAASQRIDNEIFTIINKLCFGWERVLYKGKVCWYNQYTVNLIEQVAMYNFVINYFSSPDTARCPQYLPGQGLLAEEMGLGKTVEVTALALMNPRPIEEIDEIVKIQLQAYGDLKPVLKAKTTLIIAPDSILKQWADEIVHLAPSLAITIYGGLDKYSKLNNNAGLIADYLRMFDIVFTTYSVISRELDYALYSSRNNLTRSSNKRQKSNPTDAPKSSSSEEHIENDEVYDKDALLQDYRSIFQLSMSSKKPKIANEKTDEDQVGTDYERALQDEILLAIKHNKVPDIYSDHAYQSPLMLLQFWRVVLDEVQMVSSKVSRAFQSAALIPRFHAWGVSGTPIKKDLNDLHSVLTYLKHLPFCGEISKQSWGQLISVGGDNTNEDFIRLWQSVGLRHTKAMAHDDIKLPPQHRVLMTIPFNPVEQENYNQLLEDCLAAICLDINGAPILDDWEPTGTILAYMRSWLIRLRQVCCNPQIGQLNISTRRYKSKIHLYNSKFELAVQTLKTLDNVLDDMLNSASSDIIGFERRLIQNFVDMAQFLEFILCPQEANKCLVFVTKVTQIVINRTSILVDQNTDQIEKLKVEEKKKLKIEDDDTKNFSEIPSVNSKARALEESLKTHKQRLRSYYLFLHKCYFLLASSYFQLYDEEYQEKIRQHSVKTSEIPEKVIEQLEQSYNPDIVSELLVGYLPEFKDDSLAQIEKQWQAEAPVPPEGEDISVTKIKFWEQKLYDLAEGTRSTILQSSIVAVEKTVDTRILSRDFYGTASESFVDDGSLLVPKSTKKFFKSLPLIDIDEIGRNIVGLKVQFYFNKVTSFIRQLNKQAELINEWMSILIEILCTPLLTHDKSPNGEEYEKSIVDQEKASCYLHLLNKLLTDRTEAINGPENSTKIVSAKKKQELREFDLELQRVSDKDFLNELETKRVSVRPTTKVSFQELVLEIKNIESELAAEGLMDANSFTVEAGLFESLADRIRNIFENQKLSQVLFQKELSVNCNVVFNSRVDYFKQLQQISDSVKTPSYNFDQESLDISTILLYLSNFGRSNATTSSKMGKAVSKFRYLISLTKTSMKDAVQDDDDFFLCIICRSTITVGSLTSCGHKYCKDCLEQWLGSNRSCPMCKTQISPSTVYNFTHYKPDLKANKMVDSSDEKKRKSNLYSIYKHVDDTVIEEIQQIQLKSSYSSKVDMIVKQVLYLKSKDPKVQIVVFSQWQDLLYILATAFKASNISYLASYGTLTTEVGAGRRRSKYDSVEQFKDPSQNITCFLLNAKAQASGLTLINATHIFLCEPLVNTSLELQAISRIHRIGQTKITTVWMFAIENTVEESIVLLSTNKRLQFLEDEKTSSIKSRSSTPVSSKIASTKDRDLTKAESMALSKAGGIDTLVNKGSGDGETVSNSDLWDAFFCATASKDQRTAMNLDVMTKIN